MRNLMHSNKWKTLTALALVASVTVWFAACGGSSPSEPASPVVPDGSGGSGGAGGSGGGDGGGDGGGGGGTASSGSVQIWLTDAPVDEVCEIWVFVRDIKVKPDGEPVQRLGIVGQAFDLLTLRDGQTAFLGQFDVEQGRYQFIEILLEKASDVTYVIEKDPDTLRCLYDDPVPLQVPSSKIKVKGGPFDVTQNTGITIDFDARKSLKRKGGGNGNGNGNSGKKKGWQLKPDVSILEVEQISGGR